MVASTSQAFNHRKYLTDKGSMQDSNSPGCYMLVRAKNFVCVAGQTLWWGLCEHSFLHRTMCLAKSCCRICGVSNLSHKLVLCLQFTVHTAMCPDTPGRVCTEWPIQPWCHCAEDYQLPNKQMKVKGQGSTTAGGSQMFAEHTLQSQAAYDYILFSFLHKLDISVVWSKT